MVIKIKLNEKIISIQEGLGVFDVRLKYKPDADIIVYNGFPIDKNVKLSESDELFLIKRGEHPLKKDLEFIMTARHTPKVYSKIKKAVVGIAGVGGLGSNIAVMLARIGIGKLVIADFDVVEPSNLNRQHYFIDQIGMYKTDALKSNIKRINPFVKVVARNVKLNEKNCVRIFKDVDIIAEAFDRADAKAMLINAISDSMPSKYIVSASGVAGYGPNNEIKTVKLSSKIFIVGDQYSSAMPGRGLMAPRVSIAAGHQANQILRLILGEGD